MYTQEYYNLQKQLMSEIENEKHFSFKKLRMIIELNSLYSKGQY